MMRPFFLFPCCRRLLANLVQINLFFAIRGNKRSHNGEIQCTRDRLNVPIAKYGKESVAEQTADCIHLERLKVEISRFGPDGGLRGLEDQKRVGQTICDITESKSLRTIENCVWTSNGQVISHAFAFLVFDGRLVDRRHFRNEFLIVLAVPGLVELELLVKDVLVQERKQAYPPAQQRRFAVFAINSQ